MFSLCLGFCRGFGFGTWFCRFERRDQLRVGFESELRKLCLLAFELGEQQARGDSFRIALEGAVVVQERC